MTPWSLIFLGLIALAALIMAAVQVGIIMYAGRLIRRVDRLVDQVERDLKPVISRLNEMSGEAARASGLVVAQVERADQLFADFAGRVEQILSLIQDSIVVPAQEGKAILRGLRAGLAALQNLGIRRQSDSSSTSEDDEEEALFIG